MLEIDHPHRVATGLGVSGSHRYRDKCFAKRNLCVTRMIRIVTREITGARTHAATVSTTEPLSNCGCHTRTGDCSMTCTTSTSLKGWSCGGSPIQCWIWTAIRHPSIRLVQNLNIEVITTLEDDSLQYPSAVYLKVSEERAILVKFG